MGSPATAVQFHDGLHTPRESLASRIVFRFCFVYFGLYCVLTQILGSLVALPDVDLQSLDTFPPARNIIFWAGAHVFGLSTPLVYNGSGSGDKTFDWVEMFCLLVFSLFATVIWSLAGRKREGYATLRKWFRLFLRICLAGQMFAYGIAKAIPMQMPFPRLITLLEPFGNMSPMGVLWASVGASPKYETFAGCAELLGGILLIVPRTTMLGSLISLAAMSHIFVLNMAYDVPVKLLSFHLILIALLLLAPELPRLACFFILNRSARPAEEPALFRSKRANRIALAAQLVLGLWLVGMNAHSVAGFRSQYDARSPLYGIWNVEYFAVDGQERSPLLTDNGRWRRLIFDAPSRAAFERMDDSFARYVAAINSNEKTLALTKNGDQKWKANFTFKRDAPDRLTLDGEMDGQNIQMRLQLFDREKFLLVNRGFHWIQEYPFNR